MTEAQSLITAREPRKSNSYLWIVEEKSRTNVVFWPNLDNIFPWFFTGDKPLVLWNKTGMQKKN